ncbi:MAG: formate dehydrogenase subunit gamma, partial [Firmicutes bacterium]|nr:formate dehydrogenase subunit gamma [Bacillota bacterium]
MYNASTRPNELLIGQTPFSLVFSSSQEWSYFLERLLGMVLFFGTIASTIGHGGVAFTKLVHRIAAVPFILIVPIMMIFGTPRTTKIWLKEIFTWTKDDIVWVTGFAKEFFGGHTKLPAQGRLNA